MWSTGTFGDFDRAGRGATAEAAVALKGTAEGASGLGMTTLARWRSRWGATDLLRAVLS
ncbi:putative formin-like protein 5 [Iris pallida]|uniref:Formin-like protein 5 n=1 Tax=Iris pallida TaxID=29817 RepID=A0AAX6DJA2_IRIPA|nr:putative formin-like protein 5 [Iris pallida]